MYFIGENYQGKGFGTEAVKFLINFSFKKIKLRKISAEVYPRNKISIRLLKKLGFREEGYLRKEYICRADKKIKDVVYFGLLKEDFK